MFYENERIIRKNQKYEKIKTYAIISDLEGKGMPAEEMIEVIDILISNDNSEFQTDVLKRAKIILESQ